MTVCAQEMAPGGGRPNMGVPLWNGGMRKNNDCKANLKDRGAS